MTYDLQTPQKKIVKICIKVHLSSYFTDCVRISSLIMRSLQSPFKVSISLNNPMEWRLLREVKCNTSGSYYWRWLLLYLLYQRVRLRPFHYCSSVLWPLKYSTDMLIRKLKCGILKALLIAKELHKQLKYAVVAWDLQYLGGQISSVD